MPTNLPPGAPAGPALAPPPSPRPRPNPPRPWLAIWLGVLVLASVAVAGALAWRRAHAWRPSAEEVFADPAPAYDFALTGQDGQPLRLADLRGKVVLLSFGFTHCPNICPTTLANLAWSYKLLSPAQQATVQVVFVSVDPARDTPERLAGYVPFFHPSFRGATGSAEEIARLGRAYGVFYQAEAPPDPSKPDAYNVNHSAYVYLVDKAGRYAALYGHDQLPEREQLAADLAHFADARP